MMSISKMGQDPEAYYLRLAREDYFTAGGEPPGRWAGSARDWLGLPQLIDPAHLTALIHGFHPMTGERMVQNAGRTGKGGRQAGWDLTLSAPKSVSVLWALGTAETRDAISEAHRRAVDVALRYIEAECLWIRSGHGGKVSQRAESLFAVFDHGSSREQDPQLHSHALLINLGRRSDGSFGAVESQAVYEHKMAAGALYRAELANTLCRAMSLGVEPDRGSFHLTCVPKPVCRAFSQRRSAIEAKLGDVAQEGRAVASEKVALATRRHKRSVPREELYARWREEARALGLEEPERIYVRDDRREPEPTLNVRSMVDRALASDSTVRRTDVLRESMEWAQGRGVSPQRATAAVDRELGSDRYAPVATQRHQTYTPKGLSRSEGQLFEDVKNLLRRSGARLSDKTIADTEQRHGFMRGEKRDALRHLIAGEGSLRVLDGMAGTGKTTLMEAAKEAWESEGYRVIGASSTGRGARGLENSTGIPSQTVKRLLDGLATTAGDVLAHHAKQILREATGRKGHRLDLPKLDAKTVLVVDDASLIGTRQMSELMSHVRESGGTMALVGDRHAPRAVEGASPFLPISLLAGGGRLEHIIRQKEDWAREAVRESAKGNSTGAFDRFRKEGQLVSDPDRSRLKERLVKDFLNVERDKRSQIVTPSKKEADELNRLVQKERMALGDVEGLLYVTNSNGDRVRTGDRVCLERNHKLFGVEAGSLGTVLGIRLNLKKNDFEVSVDVEGKGSVTLPMKRYPDIGLGYATTPQKALGTTVDHCFVLLGDAGPKDHALYSMISRARVETMVYTTHSIEQTKPEAPIMKNQQVRSFDVERAFDHDLGLDR